MGSNSSGNGWGGSGSGIGQQAGLMGSGGWLGGGVAQTSCDDGVNGWGAARAGGHMNGYGAGHHGFGAGHVAGCGVNGCGIGGHLCSHCRALAARALGRHGAGHPYGGMIPHTPTSLLEGQGPMTPTYVYPYYTTRGPRDFLVPNPPSIGY